MEIETGVQPPKRKKKIKWSNMVVNASFLHEFNAAEAGNRWARRNGKDWEFTGKQTNETADRPFRIWRVK